MTSISRRGFVRALGAVAALGGLGACSSTSDKEKAGIVEPTKTGLIEVEAQEALAQIRLALDLMPDRAYLTDAVAQGGELPAGTLVCHGIMDADGKEFCENAGQGQGKGYFNATHGAVKGNFDAAIKTLRQYYTFNEAKSQFVDFPELLCVCDQNEVNVGIATYLQCLLEQLGITMEVDSQDAQAFANTCAQGSYSLIVADRTMGFADPAYMLDHWATGMATNAAHFGTGVHESAAIYDLDLSKYGRADVIVSGGTWAQTYDVLVGAIRAMVDPVNRCAMMHLAEDQLMATGCVSPLYYDAVAYLRSKAVEGHVITPLGIHQLKATKSPSPDGILHVCLGAEPGSLDPARVAGPAQTTMATHLWSGLARWVKRGENDYVVEPDCAMQLGAGVPNEDGTVTYTYVLRDGLVWSDGKPLVAGDFAYGWKRAANEEREHASGLLFAAVAGYEQDNLTVQATDDKTLVVTAAGPVPYWNQLLALPAFAPVREDVAASGSWAGDAATYVCNGPYKMAAWEHGSAVTIQKNETYWDNAGVLMPQIVFHLTDDRAGALANFEAGTWQLIEQVPGSELERIKKERPEEYLVSPYMGTHYLCWNVNENILPR
ncbi:MAG: ABC transporter substrate-binding protein [Coriobacteriales bacterium]|nr:ABC transporter substrate-binding protein [Coriobacteriales bacterium]